jgi:hypothetical protein
MKQSLYLIFLFLAYPTFAQKEDFNWFLGYEGIMHGVFHNGTLEVTKDTSFTAPFIDNNSIISDKNGQFLAAFNGYRIYDKSRHIMKNGDSMWYETLPYLFGYSDEDLPQGGMFLPWPGHPDSLFLFYNSQGNADWPAGLDLACLNTFYALIDLKSNNGLGEVVLKRGTVLNDTIQYGRLTTTRHANGRDWWMLINERNTNHFYRILIDPDGIHLLEKQTVGVPVIDGLGQACFSPDGQFYAVKNSISTSVGHFIEVYDFDRCTGYLSNHRQYHYPGSEVGLGGVAFSPNSRYLYASFYYTVYQYDMYSSDLESTRILVGEYEPAPGFVASFYVMQLAPDNKIYMCATSSIKFLHVIHEPDAYGLACTFQQKAIPLPANNAFSLSFSPNFRLGPLDGSECDSLGLNNVPTAWYRALRDSIDTLEYRFTDLSYFNPDAWSWDFGDGTSTNLERHPVHSFDATGTYNVCLTVSNAYGVDTFCRQYYIGVPPPVNPVAEAKPACFSVYPNPVSNALFIHLSGKQSAEYTVKIQSITGETRIEKRLYIDANTVEQVDVSSLPTGIYFLSMSNPIRGTSVMKFVKTDG